MAIKGVLRLGGRVEKREVFYHNIIGNSAVTNKGGGNPLGVRDTNHRIVICRQQEYHVPCGNACYPILLQGLSLHAVQHTASQ